MSSVQGLREFMRRRVSAACEEVFTVFARTIAQYEEEIHRQRRQLEDIRKSQITSHRADLPQQHGRKETEIPADQQLCNQERNSRLDQEDPEPLQIKEEREEEQLELKQEADIFMVTLNYEEGDRSESGPVSDQLLSNNCPVAESPDQGGSEHVDSASTRNAEPAPKTAHHRDRSHSNDVHGFYMPEGPCNAATGTQSQMTDRHRIHAGEKWYPCETCGKIFNQSYKLTVHMRTHTGERPYPCNTCGKSFKDLSTFRKHAVIHTGEKLHSCKICGKSFSQSGSLTVHMRTHTDERPYPCDTCGKRFKGAAALKYHIRSHTGEKPYPCNTCGVRFRDLSAFRSHTAIHTGEKRFSCKICGKSFTQSSTLSVHMRTHAGGKRYPYNTATLKTHTASHTGRGPETYVRENDVDSHA